LLGRAPPLRAFEAADINIHMRLRGDGDERSPFLLDELKDILAIDIIVDETRIVITDRSNNVPA
jgi:hypothetical protein